MNYPSNYLPGQAVGFGPLAGRGMQRRAFVLLHIKALRQGGVDKLSESERGSCNQLCDALSAADQLLFERLAGAQLRFDGLKKGWGVYGGCVSGLVIDVDGDTSALAAHAV